ncbi:hypothetical protein AVEN_218960-1 [Araneus ventricosus]|uniref:Uncharacterized protein n=1 Tax=Araneus ventricosus TaxID=182803 RepID=A0A4Y2CC39_ARAVE|nr:hypothetical protein AVEN_218960-1 [Araneus ventricosus]
MCSYSFIWQNYVRTKKPESAKKAARGLLWDGPRNFESWHDDEDDTSTGTPSLRLRATPAGKRLALMSDLKGIRFISLEKLGFELRTLWSRSLVPYHQVNRIQMEMTRGTLSQSMNWTF